MSPPPRCRFSYSTVFLSFKKIFPTADEVREDAHHHGLRSQTLIRRSNAWLICTLPLSPFIGLGKEKEQLILAVLVFNPASGDELNRLPADSQFPNVVVEIHFF